MSDPVGSTNLHDPNPIRPAERRSGPEKGIGVCLSGGGYRAMPFHLGALWRLNLAGVLPRLDRISSVSGGSITAGVLGVKWGELKFDSAGVAANFEGKVVEPIRALANRAIDASTAGRRQ